MSEKKKSKPFLGRMVDLGEPGLDRLAEVRGIVASVVRDYREGIIDGKTARRILGRLKKYIRENSKLEGHAKESAIEYVNGGIRTIREMERGKR